MCNMRIVLYFFLVSRPNSATYAQQRKRVDSKNKKKTHIHTLTLTTIIKARADRKLEPL